MWGTGGRTARRSQGRRKQNGVLVDGSQGSPRKGVRWRGRLWVQGRLRRAPLPLALFCLRRVAADVLLSEPSPQSEGSKTIEDGNKNIPCGRAANNQVHDHQRPGCGQHEHNDQDPQATVRAASTCARITHSG